MAEVLLFHHALGLTDGCRAFADDLRAAGHVVHAPDLFTGRTFTELDDGVGYAQQIGFGAIIERGRAVADDLPSGIVYVGFSLGVMPAQALAQTRPGGLGAVLIHSSVPTAEFGGRWPDGVPLQIHTMEDDDWGDVEIARELAETIETADSSCAPATATCSPTKAWPTTTRGPRRWSSSGSWASSIASVRHSSPPLGFALLSA